MWILMGEALLAVALLLSIVWWTLGPTQRRERDAAMRAEIERLAREEAAKRSAAGTTEAREPPGAV